MSALILLVEEQTDSAFLESNLVIWIMNLQISYCK